MLGRPLLVRHWRRPAALYGELLRWGYTDPNEEFGGYINFLKHDAPIAGCMHNDGHSRRLDMWSVHLATGRCRSATVEAVGEPTGLR